MRRTSTTAPSAILMMRRSAISPRAKNTMSTTTARAASPRVKNGARHARERTGGDFAEGQEEGHHHHEGTFAEGQRDTDDT